MRYTVLILLLSFGVCRPILAQTTLKSLDECLSLAKQQSLELQSGKLTAEASVSDVTATRGALLPQVKAFGAFDDNIALPVQLVPAEALGGKPGEFKELTLGVNYNLQAGLEASMPLFNAVAWGNFRNARIQTKLSQAQYLQKEYDLSERVARTYYAVLLAQYATQLSELLALSTDSLAQLAQRRLQEGTAEKLDFNRTVAQRIKANDAWQENQRVLAKNSSSLNLLLGNDIGTSLNLTESLGKTTLTVDTWNGTSSLYPVLQVKMFQSELAAARLETERQRRFPELSAFARYTQQAQRNEFTFLESGQPWYQIGVVGLRLDVPLFASFSKHASVQKAKLLKQASQADYNDALARTKKEDADLVADLARTEQSMKAASESMELAKENYSLAYLKYQQGIYPLDQLISILNEWRQAQQDYLRKSSEYLTWRAVTELKKRYSE